jgi:hypothetical protein
VVWDEKGLSSSCGVSGSQSDVAKDSCFLRYATVSLGDSFMTFFRNVWKLSLKDMASHPGRPAFYHRFVILLQNVSDA